MKYLYLPFKTFKDDIAFTGTVERYKRKGHTVIRRSHGWVNRHKKPLKVVRADDLLILMGHGGSDDHNRGDISVKQVKWGTTSLKSRTHNDLAQQLMDEGLPKTHRLIKSLTCYGSGEFFIDGTVDQIRAYNGEYFAQLLAKSLGKLGYASVKVGGYPGAVCSTIDQKKVLIPVFDDPTGKYQVNQRGEHGVPTKGFVQWFDASGNETTV